MGVKTGYDKGHLLGAVFTAAKELNEAVKAANAEGLGVSLHAPECARVVSVSVEIYYADFIEPEAALSESAP